MQLKSSYNQNPYLPYELNLLSQLTQIATISVFQHFTSSKPIVAGRLHSTSMDVLQIAKPFIALHPRPSHSSSRLHQATT